jgi:hypothetical protein
MDHMKYIRQVANEDIATLEVKERTYQGSWKLSGGRSAWFMLKRKIDRIIVMMETSPEETDPVKLRAEHDIFLRAELDEVPGQDGTLAAEINDLRQYLMLVKAELLNRKDNEANRT